jgi:hypothetical protein
MTPDQIYSNSASQGLSTIGRATDLRDFSNTPLYYSGSGQDPLLAQIKTMIAANPDEAQRAADFAYSSNVRLEKFEVDLASRRVNLEFAAVGSDGRLYQYTFRGEMDSNLRMRAPEMTAGPRINVDMACMDLGGTTCQTAHIKLSEGSEGSRPVVAHVIARKTRAYMYTKAAGFGQSQNPEYDRLLAILVNTVNSSGSPDSVDFLEFTTGETVNGIANFTVQLGMRTGSTNGRQYLSWTGPLVKPSDTDSLSLPVTQKGSAITVDSGPRIGDSIRGTRLVRNDGRGNLQLEFTLRAAYAGATEDHILFTVARIHKPVRTVFIQ